MALSAVDQLNNLETSYKPRAIDYETYFGEMELSEGEIQERIELAEDLDDVFEYLFVLYLAMLKAGKKVDRDELVQTVLTRYRDVLYDNGLDIDERYPGMYGISQRSSESIVDTTIAYGALNDWYTSEDRAMFLAENEANSIANYEDLIDAIDAGYTAKTWVTMADRKVRDTHRELEGVTISIFEPFDVGGYQMMVPKDDSMGAGPEEIVNCRCSVAWGGLDGNNNGALNGAWTDENDPYNEERTRIAEEQYEQIRNRKRRFEIEAVAKNSGMTIDEIDRVFAHVFEREHLFDDGSIHRFDPDYYMFHSWQRLREGKKIYPHDMTLLKHELAEEKIMGESLEIVYQNAHNEVEKTYSYVKDLMEYLKEHDA